MNVSPNFSPPIKLMAPYFLLSALFYLLSMLSLFTLEISVGITDFQLLAWVHTYMLGFVMMGIFAAMAQLGPIVVETKHYNVSVFKYLWIILLIGLLLMIYGFLEDVTYLLIGGSTVLFAMLLYAGEFLLTLKEARRKTSITKAMNMSNFFLLTGILTGITMAAALTGLIPLNPHDILNIHTFGLLVGFVILLIMGISIILIPMFGSSARISDNEFSSSFYTVSSGVLLMILSNLFLEDILKNLSYLFTSLAIIFYFYQLFKMTKSRKRNTHDIWAKSMYVAFISFCIAFILLLSYLYFDELLYLKSGLWLLFIGLFGFVIIGNFYKIIPFLVWFHIYSPLIEERAVPMLHELLPERLAHLQWFYSLSGLFLTTIAILTENDYLFRGAIVLLSVASFIFFVIIR